MRQARGRPTLSVVVPVFNVEKWIGECLESILGQSYSDLEIVVIDDGSPDRSMDIAYAIAERDDRVLIRHQENAGLGAARNAGVREARGDLMTFVDSDDIVAPGSLELLVKTLLVTGSDFVVGRMDRDDGRRRWTTPLMRKNHLRDRRGLTLEAEPLALADVFACNKVFRRDFWVRHGLAFPEGIRYEDQPTLTRAFVAADSFDFLAAPVYYWMSRADGSSITQQRHTLQDLLDRAASKALSVEALAGSSREVTSVFFREVLPIDMWEYFRAAVTSGPDYWSELVWMVNELWNETTVLFEDTHLPAQQRLMGWLVAHNRREDLARWINELDRLKGPRFTQNGMLIHPWSGELELPRRNSTVATVKSQVWKKRAEFASRS